MLVPDGGETRDAHVGDLPQMLRPGDLLVFNDTRVIPAQLEGRRGDATIGATLHKREGPRRWRAFIRKAKRLHEGDAIDFGNTVSAIASDRTEDGSFALTFAGDEQVEDRKSTRLKHSHKCAACMQSSGYTKIKQQ